MFFPLQGVRFTLRLDVCFSFMIDDEVRGNFSIARSNCLRKLSGTRWVSGTFLAVAGLRKEAPKQPKA